MRLQSWSDSTTTWELSDKLFAVVLWAFQTFSSLFSMKSSSPLRPKTFRFFVHHRKRKFLQIQKKKTLNVVSHLQFVFVLLVHLGQQLSFTAVQGVDERVALRHQTRLELHAVLLQRDVTNRSSAFYRQVMMAKTQLSVFRNIRFSSCSIRPSSSNQPMKKTSARHSAAVSLRPAARG